jgi:hypothetical protein
MIHNLYKVKIFVDLIEGEESTSIEWCTVYINSDNLVNAFCDAVQYCQNRLTSEYIVSIQKTEALSMTKNESYNGKDIENGQCIFVEITED